MPEMKNPFQVLGLSREIVKELKDNDDALLALAKGSMRALAFWFHPDKSPQHAERMKEINEAYSFIEKNRSSLTYKILKEEYSKVSKTQSSGKAKETSINIVAPTITNVEIDFGGRALIVDSKGKLFTAADGSFLQRENKLIIGSLSPEDFQHVLYGSTGLMETQKLQLATSSRYAAAFPFAVPSELVSKVYEASVPLVKEKHYLISGRQADKEKRQLDLFIEGEVLKLMLKSIDFNALGELAQKTGQLETAIMYYSEAENASELIRLGDSAKRSKNWAMAAKAYVAAEAFDKLAKLGSECPDSFASVIAAFTTHNKVELRRIGQQSLKKKELEIASLALYFAGDSIGYVDSLIALGQLSKALDYIIHHMHNSRFMDSVIRHTNDSYQLEEIGMKAIELAKNDRTKYDIAFRAFASLGSIKLTRKLGEIALERKHFDEAEKAFRRSKDEQKHLDVLEKAGYYEELYNAAKRTNNPVALRKVFDPLMKKKKLDIALSISIRLGDESMIKSVAKRAFELDQLDIAKRAYHALSDQTGLIQVANGFALNGELENAFYTASEVEKHLCKDIAEMVERSAECLDLKTVDELVSKYSSYIEPSVICNSAIAVGHYELAIPLAEKLGKSALTTLVQKMARERNYKLARKVANGARSKLNEYHVSNGRIGINDAVDDLFIAIGDIAEDNNDMSEARKCYESLSNEQNSKKRIGLLTSRIFRRPAPMLEDIPEYIPNKKKLAELKKNIAKLEEVRSKIREIYSNIRTIAEKDWVKNRKVLFHIYNLLNLKPKDEKEVFQKLAKKLAKANYHKEAVQANRRAKGELTEDIMKSYMARGNELEAGMGGSSAAIYKRVGAFSKLLDIVDEMIQDPLQAKVPDGDKRFTSVSTYLSDYYRNALDYCRFTLNKSKDPKILERAKKQVERIAELSEKLMLGLLEENAPRGEHEGNRYDSVANLLRVSLRANAQLDWGRMMIKCAELLTKMTDASSIEIIIAESLGAFPKKEEERELSQTEKNAFSALANTIEKMNRYEDAVRFIKKIDDSDKALRCGDRALEAGFLDQAFRVYRYHDHADKDRWFRLLEVAREKRDGYLVGESLRSLNNRIDPEERARLIESIKKDPEYADKIILLLPKYCKKKIVQGKAQQMKQ